MWIEVYLIEEERLTRPPGCVTRISHATLYGNCAVSATLLTLSGRFGLIVFQAGFFKGSYQKPSTKPKGLLTMTCGGGSLFRVNFLFDVKSHDCVSDHDAVAISEAAFLLELA